MGVIDGVRSFYFSLEDRYYAGLDFIESKGVPIYKVVDPIDSVVPSFPLFTLLVLLLVAALVGFLVLPALSGPSAVLSVRVTDFSDQPLAGAKVTVYLGSAQTLQVSNALGKADFNFAKGSVVRIVVSRNGYDDFESPAFTLTENKDVLARLSLSGSASGGEAVVRTMRFLSQTGQPLSGEEIRISFSCSNPAVAAPADVSTTASEIKVTEPAACNGLIADVLPRNFAEIPSQLLSQEMNTFYLKSNSASLDADRATLDVIVTTDGATAPDGMEILLYAADSPAIADRAQTIDGHAVFSDVAYGPYTVKSLSTAQWGVKSIGVTVDSKKETVSLALEKNVVGSIRIKVVDRFSNDVVANATVSLQLEGLEVEKKLTGVDNNGYVTFFVSKDATYTVGVSHPDYCFEQRTDLRITPGTYVIEIDPFTDACGGILNVKVVDQQGQPVENATVSLATEQHFFIGTAQRVSDLNGVARFLGMKTGTYTAFAFKGSISGWSDAQYFNRKAGEPEKTDLVATLEIPDGMVHLEVVDREGQSVPFASVTFIDAFDGRTIGGGPQPMDANGTLDWTTRADKTVYALIEKDGFASVATPWMRLAPSTVISQRIELLPPVTKFEVELLGLYQGNLSVPPSDTTSASLAAGNEYVARFRIRIPSDHLTGNSHPFNELGIHIRTGDDPIMEKDLLFLKGTSAPQATQVRSTSYTGNYATDIGAVTTQDAKWVNLTWHRPLASVMMVETVLFVKENAALGKKVDLYYRAWGKNGGTTRDPADATGSNSELYSDTLVAGYTIGVGTLCDDRFCFDASIYDQLEALRTPVTDSFAAKSLQDYTLSFSIANVSRRDTDSYRNSELRVMALEENLLFKQYTIFDASAQGSRPITGTANKSELPRIGVGDLSPGRKFSGELAFSPQKAGTHTIDFKIVDTDLGQIVFSKQISILSAADKDFVVVVVPEKLSPGIENPVLVTVTDKETGIPVATAIVRIRDKFKNMLMTATTNSLGNAELRLPAQVPGEILDLEVERIEYNTVVRKLTVDGRLIELSPQSMGFSVNPKTHPSESKDLKISNVAPFELSIERM
ncbi:MAG: carboxypeptidase-like regulatory domain-containing protein, partial [Candidatus Diapherotrites archaeon]|nr:carboxypeptidase-like regulatory domain-containing protein [Candidatus Diapherotrites archaeon]